MSNTRKATPKTYKFQKFQKAAEQKRAQSTEKPLPVPPPFVIDDVEPHIKITAPDTLERKLIIADNHAAWRSGQWNIGGTIPLLQALCGDQFGRVWSMIKDSPDELELMELIRALFDHFSDALSDVEEAEELPGGSSDSSN